MLVDGSAYIFRAYHALPPLTRKSDGLPVGAIAGFCNMLWKLREMAADTSVGENPTHLAVIFDAGSKTFRNDIYPEYKANRSETPEDLRPQFSIIREATRAFNVACVERDGYEADDIIATYARVSEEIGAHVTIVSSDKDLMQLVSDTTIMFDQMKDKVIRRNEVIEKFGVGPEKMIDLQALTGDSTDNVPGVPGIGPKTAAQLLSEYGDLEILLERAGEIKQKKRRENLIEFAEQARLSRRLVELDQNTPLDVPLGAFAMEEVDGSKLIAFLKAMEFTTLTRRVADATQTDAEIVDKAAVSVEHWDGADNPSDDSQPTNDSSNTPSALVEQNKSGAFGRKIDHESYEIITDIEVLRSWCEAACEQGFVSFDTETTSLDAMQAELVGFSLALAPGKAAYVPLTHKSGAGDLLGGGILDGQIPTKDALEVLKPLLENPAVLKIAQNLKYDALLLANYDIDVISFDDTMLLSYALDTGLGGHGMDELSKRWLDHEPIPFKSIAGSGKSMITFDFVPIADASRYAAEDADITLRLWQVLKPRLPDDGMTRVYETLERPMVPVLMRMEKRGISVDRQMLSRLSGEFAQGMARLEEEITELAGSRFNIGSPKQLGEILFGKMELPGGKKTKTGAWSTSATVLEELAAAGHELPRKIVDWRQLSKLKSTYTDALPGFINPSTQRVHTSYSLASTSTGRLSSSDPNLQNIPVRTESGRRIRQAFVAAADHKLISADYSQIELRVLAHIADIPQLKQAFADGLDIHAMTASEMFNVPIQDMDPMVRRQAKAINFGIIYGISAFGLANQLGISRSDAKNYIETYFERFPGIQTYMEDTKTFARAHGYVETIFGRRAHYPEINTKNPNMRSFMERAAINAPIQGSAADIIRRAMLRMEKALDEAKLSAQMLLQVHDELIFEVPDDEVEATLPVVTSTMEQACLPALDLSVPIKVDARAANNWHEAH